MALRWGIAGAGRISHDFVCAVQTHPKTDHIVVAVAARSQESADTFANVHGIPRSYEGYDQLATDPNIDIVYVGNLNPQHYEVSKLIMEHGKHVLCEKPLTMNEKQTTKLVQISHAKKVFLMEAIWSRCFPAYKDLKNFVDSGTIGEIQYVSVEFGHALTAKRLTNKEMGGGVILDLGVYVLQFQQLIFRGLKPTVIACHGHLNTEGTEDSASISITYPEGKMAVLYTTSKLKLPNQAMIAGTKGTIKVPDFWCPTQVVVEERIHTYGLPKTNAEFLHYNSVGLAYEAEEARQCIKAGKLESELMPHSESIELARLMDTCRKQLGVTSSKDLE